MQVFNLITLILFLFAHHLQVRYADVETLIHVGVPHNPHIGDVDRTKITLHATKLNNDQYKYSSHDRSHDHIILNMYTHLIAA